MARQKKRSTLYSTGFMIVLTVIVISLLGVLNQVTRPTIQQIEAEQVIAGILNSAGIDYTEENITQVYDENIRLISPDGADLEVYEIVKDGQRDGYVFEYVGGALWGEVQGYIGVDDDLETILGVDIVKNSETPGLGGRITEDWFKDQFAGLPIDATRDFLIYRPNDGGNVDAITGATQTSDAMRRIFNQAIREFVEMMEGVN
ncbi:MAG: FMN-binding protein [Tissierellia bacterium]|nr:FMN-binding protein [Tissierellia bacterium]